VSEPRDPDGAAEVVIVGAGPAGCATALALRRAGVPRVVLVDRPPRQGPRVGESASPHVGFLLTRLGLPVKPEDMGHRAYYGNLSLWGGPEPVVDYFLWRGTGHGWHLDRAAFDDWLRDAAVACGVRLIAPATLVSVERVEQGGWRLGVRDGVVSHLATRVVVDATGRRAAVATRLGARRRRLDRLIGLVAHTRLADDASLRGLSFIEAVAYGWWYAACLPDGRAIVTLMTDADVARSLRLHHPEAYRAAWGATARLRDLVPPPPVQTLPITVFSGASQYMDRVVGPGWIAVGDAMIGCDPLTSSGISGALDDALTAVETVLQWFSSSSGSAAQEAASQYARRAETTLRRYLHERHRYYSAEGRWPDHPFWSRRLAGEP
jgi:flavin-dependent dehydrogenase